MVKRDTILANIGPSGHYQRGRPIMPFLPFIPFPSCAEVVISHDLGGQIGLITLGIKGAAPYDAAGLSTLLGAIDTWISTDYAAMISNGIPITLMKATALDTASSPSVSQVPTTTTGTVASPQQPGQVAFGVTFQTALRGRSFRGRNYVPGVPASFVANSDSYTTVAVSLVQAIYDDFPVQLGAVSAAHVVLSRYTGGAARIVGVATPVTSYRANIRPVTQRKRLV